MAEKIGLSAVLEMSGFNRGKADYTSGITDMEGKTSTFADKLKGAGSSILGFGATLGKVALGAVAGATAAVGGLAIGVGKLAMEAAPLEGIGIAFEAMAGKVGLSVDTLREAAKGTISDFELMRMANVALVGAGDQLGQEFGAKLPGLLEIARASAKATGQDVGFLFNSLVTGIKRTSPMLIDNTGLQLKLSEANQALADSLGKSVDELTAEEKQIALLNATMEAGQVMVDQFGSEQLTAAERIAQFRAQMQNLKDQIGLAFIPAFQALLGPIAELAQKYGPQIIEWAQRAGEWLGEHLPLAIDWLAEKWQTVLKPALEAVWAFIQERVIPIFQKVYEWLKEKVPEAIEAAKNFWENTLLPALRTVWTFIQENIVPVFKDVYEWLKTKIPEAIEVARQFWEETLQPALQNIWSFLQENIFPALSDLYNWFMTKLPEGVTTLLEKFGLLKEDLPQVQVGIEDLGGAMSLATIKSNELADSTEKQKKKWIELGEKLIDFNENALTVLWEKMKIVWDHITLKWLGPAGLDKFIEKVGLLDFSFQDAKDSLVEMWNKFKDFIEDSPFIQEVLGGLKDAWAAIRDVINSIADAVQRLIDLWSFEPPSWWPGGGGWGGGGSQWATPGFSTAPVGVGPMTTQTVNVNMGGVNITSGMDMEAFAARVETVVKQAVQGY